MPSSNIERLYDRWLLALSYLRSPVLLAMRLYWGWQFFVAGKGKLLNLDRTAEFFASLGIPLAKLNALIAGSAECFGGLLLLLGLGSRIVTVPLIVTMCVAYLTAHSAVVKDAANNPDGFVSASPFLFLLCSVIVLVFGPGVFSIDALIARLRGRTAVAQLY